MRLWYQAGRDPLQELLVSVRPLELFIATLLNPKAVIFAMALFPVQTWLSVSNYAGVMGRFVLLVASIGGLWIVFGSLLMGGRVRWLQPQVFQRLAALTLGFCGLVADQRHFLLSVAESTSLRGYDFGEKISSVMLSGTGVPGIG